VDILEIVLETGLGTSLQCSQHGRVVQVALSKVKHQEFMDGTRMRNGGSHRPIIGVVRRLRGIDNSKGLLRLSRALALRVVVPDPDRAVEYEF
jgi:hypothetical protein